MAPSGAAIGAHVRDAGEGATTLLFFDGDSDPIAVLAGGHVAIQYTNNRGICRVDGLARPVEGADGLRVDHTGEVELLQRREFVRIDATVRVTYEPIGAGVWTAETTTINLSGGGFMLAGHEGLLLGEKMRFVVDLDGDSRESGPLQVIGRVVRDTRGGLGVEIDEVDEAERDRLIRWLFERQRRAVQIVRGNG